MHVRNALKPFAALAVLAAIGCASLFLSAGSLIETLPTEAVKTAGGPAVIAALMVLQSFLLSLAAIAIGLALAGKSGLRSLIVDRLRGEPTDGRGFLSVALGTGLAAGVLIIGGDLLFWPWTDAALSKVQVQPDERLPALVMGMLYGGITEEILLRWAMLSLLAWLFLRLGLRRPKAIWLATIAAAFLFALAHLPALAASIPLTGVLVARTLLLNAGAGILFGLAYTRHSLEAAMVAHAAAHLVIFAGRVAGIAY